MGSGVEKCVVLLVVLLGIGLCRAIFLWYPCPMPNQTLRIVVVPGLDDGKYNILGLVSRIWNSDQVQIYPLPVGWRNGASYKRKLATLLELVDELLATGDPVAIVGISAGASLALNAYTLRPRLLGMANLCGTLRFGLAPPASLTRRAWAVPAYHDSVLACEVTQEKLTVEQRRRVLIMKPLRDGIVPLATMTLRGAKEHRVVGVNHSQSIVTALLLYRRTMVGFFQDLLQTA